MRRVVLKSPVLENCTPGSVRGAPGNRRPYLAIMERWRTGGMEWWSNGGMGAVG
jgi:hypothetical protein